MYKVLTNVILSYIIIDKLGCEEKIKMKYLIICKNCGTSISNFMRFMLCTK